VHLDGLKEHHDKAVSQKGVFDRAVSGSRPPSAGFHRQRQRDDLRRPRGEDIANSSDFTTELGVGVSMSPAMPMSGAPDQEHFLNRNKTKKVFRDVFALGKGKKVEFHAFRPVSRLPCGNQNYGMHAVGHAGTNIIRRQKPCYLLGEGYTKTSRS